MSHRDERDGWPGQVLITPTQHAGHHGWVKVIKYKVKVIKCKVIKGMVNEVRSLSVCCCYCCYYMSHVIKDKGIECMLLMSMCDVIIEGERVGGAGHGINPSPHMLPLSTCK